MTSINSTGFGAERSYISQTQPQAPFYLLKPLRQRIDNFIIQDAKTAHRIAKLIPAQCPFSRKISVWGHTLINIPPLCKLNPLYDELVGLRFRALCFLADNCGEDISIYCQ